MNVMWKRNRIVLDEPKKDSWVVRKNLPIGGVIQRGLTQEAVRILSP